MNDCSSLRLGISSSSKCCPVQSGLKNGNCSLFRPAMRSGYGNSFTCARNSASAFRGRLLRCLEVAFQWDMYKYKFMKLYFIVVCVYVFACVGI